MASMFERPVAFRFMSGALVLLLLFLGLGSAPAHGVSVDELDLAPQAYLPFVARLPAPEPVCNPNTQEQQIAALMASDPGQQRSSLTCHPILAQVARERAQDMVDRHYFDHTNPDGFGPNYLVRQAGYVLPSFYGTAPAANNIESIAAGNPTASLTWAQWMSSPRHRSHLLGTAPFWAEQIEYGIGYANGGIYGHYWVVITAKPGP
jgi:uncharacterized protein YkwD